MGCKIIQNQNQPKQNIIDKLFINEAFISEKNSSMTSQFSAIANDVHLGKFKCSGIIVAAGTGSSGWLYGAKRMTSFNVHDIIRELKEYAKDN